MNIVLFVLIHVRNFLGAHFQPIANLYQATSIPMGVCLLHELMHPGKLTCRAFVLHIVPALAALVLYAFTLNHTLYIMCKYVLACYGMVGMLWAGVALYRYNRSIRQWSSCTEGVDVQWVFHILGYLALLFVVWTLASYCGVCWFNVLYNVSCSVIFASIALCLRAHEVVLMDDEEFDVAPIIEASSAPKPDYPFAGELDRLFCEERIFLNPRLTINLLAERLGTNRTYLSAYINKQLNVSFWEYLNRYRIDYAHRLLTSQLYTVEAVTSMCGFNSLSAFRRTFVAVTGMPPGQYRRDILEAARNAQDGQAEA